MGEWTFLTNHALVLLYLAKHPRITERAVRKIIADLEMEGYIEKEKEGRRVRYFVNPKLPFRHHTQKDKAIEKLLRALGWKGKK